MKRVLMQIILEACRYSTEKKNLQDIENKVQMHLFESNTWIELIDGIWSVLSDILPLKKKEKRVTAQKLLQSIQDYIKSHISESLSVPVICNVFGISPSYLSRIFRKYANDSFSEYVTLQRIEEAKGLMEEFPEMSMKGIALKTGFNDQFYFSKVFRSLTGHRHQNLKMNSTSRDLLNIVSS